MVCIVHVNTGKQALLTNYCKTQVVREVTWIYEHNLGQISQQRYFCYLLDTSERLMFYMTDLADETGGYVPTSLTSRFN